MRLVSPEEARRIAVHAQLLDGSATSVLDTVRGLGFLQIDPISTVAPPQHLVLWSRLGSAYDQAELDRLLWEEKKLFEYNAFIRPIEDLPLIRARMRRRRGAMHAHERRGNEFMKANARYKRHLLRELEHSGPLLSREIAQHSATPRDPHPWWGSRQVALMLMILEGRGVVAVVGRRNGQRLWDLAERWYPETETVPDARRSASSPSAASVLRACGSRRRAGKPTPTRPTGRSPTARRCSRRSTASSTTAIARRRCGTSSIAWRCTCRRRSGSTATTCYRYSSATGSSAVPSLASTARRRRSSCSARGTTPPGWTRRWLTWPCGSARHDG